MTFYQDCLSPHDTSKTNFNITWQKCSFGDPLSRFSSSHQKNMAAGGGWGVGVGGGGGQGYKIYTKILEQ